MVHRSKFLQTEKKNQKNTFISLLKVLLKRNLEKQITLLIEKYLNSNIRFCLNLNEIQFLKLLH